MSTAAYNRSRIRHLPMHARDCLYYNNEDCTCGLGNRIPTANLPSQTRSLAFILDREQMWRDPMGLKSPHPSNLSVHQRHKGSNPHFHDQARINDPQCWCNMLNLSERETVQRKEHMSRHLPKELYGGDPYANLPCVMRTYHGEKVIVPYKFPHREPPYGWGFRNSFELREPKDYNKEYLEVLQKEGSFHGTFFKPAGVSGRNGVQNGFWPFGGPKEA